MSVVVMNSEAEIATLTGKEVPVDAAVVADNARRENKDAPKNGAAEVKADDVKGADDAADKGAAKSDDDAPAFVKRFGLTAEQNDGVTKVFQEKIGKKNLQRKEAEDFAAEQYNQKVLAEQRAEQLERENKRLSAQLEGKKPEAAAVEAEEPKREAYESDELHRKAVIKFHVDQELKARDEKAAKDREEQRQAEIVAACRERIQSAYEIVPDYAEVIDAAEYDVPPHIASYMQESKMVAELGYHFAKHPEDLERLAKMPARTYAEVQRLGVAIGEIQSTLQPFAKANKADAKADGDPPTKQNGTRPNDTDASPTQARAAAPVIRPLSSGSDSQVEKSASQRSYAEERAAFEKRQKRNLGHRARH